MKFDFKESVEFIKDRAVIVEVLEYTSETCFKGKIIKDEQGCAVPGSLFEFNENDFDLTSSSLFRRYVSESIKLEKSDLRLLSPTLNWNY